MAAEAQPLLNTVRRSIPKSPWAVALKSQRNDGRYLPQNIAHRGYKAEFPENTMAGFKAAVGVGAHAIETDLHLSSDGVIVLTHDGSLKRTYGVEKKVNECTWEYLSTLKTVREPHESMPRLLDLLEWLAEPELEKTWVVLDIKMDDSAEDLLSALVHVLAQVPASVPWDKRIVLGCWNATFLETARRLLPAYPLALISFSTLYARHFLPVTNVGFNMLRQSILGYLGGSFLRAAHQRDRLVLSWTVNDEAAMRWCLDRNLQRRQAGVAATGGARVLDGVITDDPKLFREVCERWEDEQDGKAAPPPKAGLASRVRSSMGFAFFQVMIAMYHFLGVYVHGHMNSIKDRAALEASEKK
ncbi:PLC-like phosphodiesterase [Stachybotrys elegans]|uniref:PLC-like phosphodiesterase n=1 Tax=Stachybotrys elegans TaxID=80388 RepID=A0A8K0SYQ2_9HYPO|nr:PLC-like phosphodiesterase [Stachybotrys elegans]